MSVQWYDRAGQPLLKDYAQVERLLADPEYKIVKRTELGDVVVSTVWLGIDHRFGNGPPLIFETMIFGGEHDNDQWHYATEAEAEAHHDALVTALREGVKVLPDERERGS